MNYITQMERRFAGRNPWLRVQHVVTRGSPTAAPQDVRIAESALNPGYGSRRTKSAPDLPGHPIIKSLIDP